MSQQKLGLKAFIDIDEDKVVLIPKDSKYATQTHLTVDIHIPNIRGIRGQDYKDLVAELGYDPTPENASLTYFTERYKEQLKEGVKGLSDTGIEVMFKQINREYILSDILTFMPNTLSWHETELSELIAEVGLIVEDDDSRGAKLDAMQDHLDEISDQYCYMDEYEMDGKMFILYTK